MAHMAMVYRRPAGVMRHSVTPQLASGERDGQIAALDSGSATSSELIQRHLPGAQVVKAFNNIYYRHLLALARPTGASDRSFLPIAGDDAEAKARVSTFLDAIGYGAVDAGPLADSTKSDIRDAYCPMC